jgi:hypothetical protein
MLLKRLFLFVCLLGVFTSCHKDKTSAYNYFTNGTGYMGAIINGNTWYATSGYAQNTSNTTINLYGTQNNVSYMVIGIDNYYGVGNYTLGGFNSAIFNDGNGIEYTATSGNVNVTSDDGTNVIGTYYFSGVSSTGGYSISAVNGNFYLQR